MSRSVIPPSRAGLVLLFAVVTPVVLRTCRPLTRKLGQGMAKLGEKLQEYAREGTSPSEDAPKPGVKAETKAPTNATTKVGASTRDAAVDTASPTGQEEMQATVAAEAKNTQTVPKPPAAKKAAGEVKTKPDQPLNPKRTAVTPPKPAKAKAKPKPKGTPGVSQ